MSFIESPSNNLYEKLNIPFYKRPAFASIAIGLISLLVIVLTQRYVTKYMDAELGLVTEISVATVFMFILFVVVNQLQASISKKQALLEKSHEIEAIRSEFTNIASKDIAEASTAIKWGIRSLEPSFESMKKGDKETLQHLRDKNDHVLEIVRNLVLLSRIERNEIVISKTITDINGLIENLIYVTSPRVKAKGTKVTYIPSPTTIKIETDPIILSDIILSIFIYCLERTHNALDEITVKLFTINSGTEETVKIIIEDSATPLPDYMRENIFARAIRNPHTGELENTPLGPHVANLLSDVLKIKLEANLSETQTSFGIIFPSNVIKK